MRVAGALQILATRVLRIRHHVRQHDQKNAGQAARLVSHAVCLPSHFSTV